MTFIHALMLAAAVQEPQTVDRIVVEPVRIEVQVDSVRTLTARVGLAGAERAATGVAWVSMDPRVASIDADGRVRGVAPGVTRVAARIGSAVATAEIVVPALPAAVAEIEFARAAIAAGTSASLDVVFRDRLGNIVEPEPSFLSSAPDIATVDQAGRVVALRPGAARITISAGSAAGAIDVRVTPNPAADYRVAGDHERIRTGDVVRFHATGLDASGRELGRADPEWLLDRPGARIEAEDDAGVFVAEQAGRYRVTAWIGPSILRSATIDVEPREADAELRAIGHGLTTGHHAGDTWAFEGADGRDYAYIGTFMHDWAKVFDITDPANPVLTDSIQLDARRINDVKIHPNGRVGILTREQASNRRNGIVILDLATPAHPRIISEYTETVTGGVHNVWVRGDADLVYACHNGTGDIHIIDISDPTNPREVGRWGPDTTGPKTLHDVIVQDGYAYASYWDDGVITLDVGAGTHGGTPTRPAFVSQFKYPEGNTHTAWRHGRYLFVGDEIFPSDWNADRPIEARGYVHVLDMSDIGNPREVAHYEVPEAGAHNLWADGDHLYIGYYQAGLRVVDIAGELRGDLYRQGREIASLSTASTDAITPNWSMTWGAQLFKGNIVTADLNSGLWIARLVPQRVVF